ncbi:MAG: deaminase [Oscillospiraceae bacterium]
MVLRRQEAHHGRRSFMEQALALAREAAQEGEVPVGCIITLGDQVVGRGRNRRERSRNALSHGELGGY